MTIVELDGPPGSFDRRARGAAVPDSIDARAKKLGLRPEAVQIVGPGEGLWRGQVVGIEDLGFQAFVFCELEDGSLICALTQGASGVARGDAVGLSTDLSLAHAFGAEGTRLS
jgi:ABC-type sugar transport system ATPase subunit